MIPKIIHYVWMGGNEKPELILKCIESWKKYLPDYEIIEWNEGNFDVSQCEYAQEAYRHGMWAYVSDYVRFKVLEQYGGIYIDTDVEFLHPLPKSYLEIDAFTCCEDNGSVNPGLIFGCIKELWLVKEVIEEYERRNFDPNKLITVNEVVTNKLINKGYIPQNRIQNVSGVRIYSDDYFCSYDKDIHKPNITENTISIHHYMSSWKKKSKSRKALDLMMGIIGIKNYKRLQKIKRQLFGIKGENKDFKI